MTYASTPWKACSRDETRTAIVRDSDGLGIAHVFGLIDAETDANARLISAAPDLLDALRKLLFEHDAISMQHDGTIDDRWPYAARIARAAIAKAEGAA
jgi:hypothetical protein